MSVYVIAELELRVFVIESRDMIGDTYIITYISVYAYMCELLKLIGRTDRYYIYMGTRVEGRTRHIYIYGIKAYTARA